MYAVVEIAGHQVRVDKGQHLKVPKLDLQEGASHQISEVLMLGDTDRTQVGQPHVEGAAVQANKRVLGPGGQSVLFRAGQYGVQSLGPITVPPGDHAFAIRDPAWHERQASLLVHQLFARTD